MSLSDIYGGDFLKAEHIQDRWPVTVTITATEVHQFDDGKRQICLHFRETDKKLGLNKTNATRVAETFGNENWQTDWIGRQLTLMLEKVEYQGKIMPAIRVKMPELRPPTPAPQQTAPPQQAPAPDSFDSNDDVPW